MQEGVHRNTQVVGRRDQAQHRYAKEAIVYSAMAFTGFKALGIIWIAGSLTHVLAQHEVMRQFTIIDPVLEMPAWTLNVPAAWKAEGTMLPGSSCEAATTPVLWVSSPDGLTGLYLLPRTDWSWGVMQAGVDCQRLTGIATAADYLNSFIRIRQLELVRELPVPELADARRNLESLNQQARGSMHFTTDMARSLVHYSIKDQPIEEWLTVSLNCNTKTVMGAGQQNECSAFVSRWFAPLEKLDARIPQFQAMKMTLNQQWMERWKVAMVQRSIAMTGPQNEGAPRSWQACAKPTHKTASRLHRQHAEKWRQTQRTVCARAIPEATK